MKLPHLFSRRVFAPFLISVLGWTVLSCEQKPRYEPIVNQPINVDKAKAPDFEIKDLSGGTISLKDLEGKIVFLDFWATWCPPCLISSPEVERLGEDFPQDQVVVISVSVDAEEEDVRQFLKAKGWKGRFAMAGNSGIDAKFNISSLPTFFLINPEGQVVGTWQGYSSAMVGQWRSQIKRLLNESA